MKLRTLFSVLLMVFLIILSEQCLAGTDRAITSVIVTPAVAHPGDVISVTYTAKNLGDVSTETDASVYFPPIASPQGKAAFSLGVGEERTVGPFDILLPSDLTAGAYYLKACISAAIIPYPDQNTGNDCLQVPLEIDSPNFIDLTIDGLTSGTSRIYPRIEFPVSATITNNGNAESGQAIIAVYLSRDQTLDAIDTELEGYALAARMLEPGESRVLSEPKQLFSTILSPGNYYILACARLSFNVKAEADQTNNCRSMPIELMSFDLTTNLGVAGIRLPASAGHPGDSFIAFVDIFNEGPAAAGNFEISAAWSELEAVSLADYRFTGELTAGATATIPFEIPIPLDSNYGTYSLTVCVDTKNEVLETEERFNCWVLYDSFTIEGRRDVEAISLQINPSSAEMGQEIAVSYQMRNNGYILNSPVRAAIYWSADEIITRQDPQLLDLPLNNFGTEGNNEHSGSAWMKVPFNARPGTYYLGICIDPLDWIRETDEGNNCRTTPITIREAVLPSSYSFKVQSVDTDILQVDLGGTFNTFIRIENNGSLPTGDLLLKVWLVWDPYDVDEPEERINGILLGMFKTGSIPAGVYRLLGPIPLQVPSSPWSNPSYLLVRAMALNASFKSSLVSPLYIMDDSPPLHDFRSSGGGNQIEVVRGSPFMIHYGLGEMNFTVTPISAQTSIRWSDDETITSEDPEIGTAMARPGVGYTQSEGAIIMEYPDESESGYLGICADWTNAIPETDEDNNCSTLKINAVSTPREKADLRITDLKLSSDRAAAGEYVTVSFDLGNYGTAPTAPFYYQSVYTDIVWSPGAQMRSTHPVMATVVSNPLAAGQRSSFSIELQMPSGQPSGQYFIGVCHPSSAYADLQCETIPVFLASDTTNDVHIHNLTVDSRNGRQGEPLWISFGLNNTGNSATPAFPTAIRWSKDAKIDALDPVLRQFAFGGLKANDGLDIGPFKIEIPLRAPAGFYYLAVCADSSYDFSNSVVETNEVNNCKTVTIMVMDPAGRPPRQGIGILPARPKTRFRTGQERNDRGSMR